MLRLLRRGHLDEGVPLVTTGIPVRREPQPGDLPGRRQVPDEPVLGGTPGKPGDEQSRSHVHVLPLVDAIRGGMILSIIIDGQGGPILPTMHAAYRGGRP